MGVTERVAALSGAAYMVLANISMNAAGSASEVPTGQESLDTMHRIASDPMARVMVGVHLLAIVPWMVFIGYVCWRVRAAGLLAAVALVGGLVGIAVKLGSFPLFATAYSLRDEISPETAHVLDQMNLISFMISVMPAGLFVLCAAAAALSSHQLGRVLGWSGIVIGAANIVVPVVTWPDMGQSAFSLSFVFLGVWELVVSLRWGFARSRPRDSISHQSGSPVTT